MHLNTIIDINDVSFEYQQGQIIFEKLNLALKNDSKIGLVGANGSGKTTLFKLLLGELTPENGHVKKYGVVSYVPQIDLKLLESSETLQNYLSSKNENWWEIHLKLEEIFKFNQDLNIPMKSLSGGELMKINIAVAMANNPGLLLLDEPTNHLDISSTQKLVEVLKSSNISYLVVSHDIFFLDQVVNKIWEIENKKISVYGGNYSSYKEQKKYQIESRQRKYSEAKTRLESINTLKQKEKQRTAHNTKATRDAYFSGSTSSWEYVGGERGKASLSASFLKKVKKITKLAEADMEDNEVFNRNLSHINIKNVSQKSGQTLIRAENFDLKIKNELLISNLSFSINFGERVNIAGSNGTGKTLLTKSLLEAKGIYRKDNLKYLYIDQNYSLLNFNKNLIDNLIEYIPGFSESDAKEQLGKLQFKNISEHIKLAKDLSGGEMARLTLAITTALPLELLILDEPTNNLDVETVEIMIGALNRYKGGLIVISHNIEFLSQIGIDKSYIIKNKHLKETMNLPVNKDLYYSEMTEA